MARIQTYRSIEKHPTQIHQFTISGSTSIKILRGKTFFRGAGKTLKKSSVLTTVGGKDPQKVIGFDHFEKENPILS